MLYKCLLAMVLVSCAGQQAGAATLQLKDNASVTGKILAEKREHIALDLGFTVLMVPRTQIVEILRRENSVETEITPAAMDTEPGVPKPLTRFYASGGTASQSRSVRELVRELGEAVVQVRTPSGLGSGFVLNNEGYLITNFHVIEGETQITVEVYHGGDGELNRKSYKQVRIVAMNKFEDLALLHIQDKGTPKFKHVTLGNSDSLAVGERVFAIGSPLGLERTVTEGIVSTKTRQMQGELYLQTTAQINPGNSGGPLFNLNGEVVGVTNMKITFGEGLGFAIPIEAVRFFLDHRDAYAYSNDNPANPYRYLEPPSKARRSAQLEEIE